MHYAVPPTTQLPSCPFMPLSLTGEFIFNAVSSPAQLYISTLLLRPPAGNSLSMANFSSAHSFTFCNMLINQSRGEFPTGVASLFEQFNFTHVLLNRVAGDNLSRNLDIPAASVITRRTFGLDNSLSGR